MQTPWLYVSIIVPAYAIRSDYGMWISIIVVAGF